MDYRFLFRRLSRENQTFHVLKESLGFCQVYSRRLSCFCFFLKTERLVGLTEEKHLLRAVTCAGTIRNFIRRKKRRSENLRSPSTRFFSSFFHKFTYIMASKRFICRLTWQSLQSRYTPDLEVSRQVRSLLPADIAGRSGFTLSLNFLRLVSSFAFQSRQSRRVVHRDVLFTFLGRLRDTHTHTYIYIYIYIYIYNFP